MRYESFMNQPPVFLISLDFELHWGRFDKWPLDPTTKEGKFYQDYFSNTRKVIPQMLQAMQHHGVHATWATVGFLFHKSREELTSNYPTLLPTFTNQQMSAYHFIDTTGIGKDESDDPFHFGASLIHQINQTAGMEVGSQTHSHYYACAPGQTADQFRADLKAACAVAKARGINIVSIVMPKNEVNSEYLPILKENGILAVRVNPDVWYWDIPVHKKVTTWNRLCRTADCYFPIGKRKSFSISSIRQSPSGPWLIPASRFLRPHNAQFTILNRIRMRRILNEMNVAARNGEVYHLWWHPHNFGAHPVESMRALDQILNHFQQLKNEYGMISLNMAETTALIARQSSAQ